MEDIKLSKPEQPANAPSALTPPELKQKEYHAQAARSIWWSGWANGNITPFNTNRGTWINNRAWARGIQDNYQFAIRPPAKNDHTKNPLLKHIDFSTVNEMVKYCDIFCSLLEENDYEIQATAINPAAATLKQHIKSSAQAYMMLRPFFDQMNKTAGADVAPKNPMNGEMAKMGAIGEFDFENSQELEVFFQIGFKLQQELQIEIGNEVVLNESKWPEIRKKICEDIRDTGYAIVKSDVDTNNRIRYKYMDPCNSGWEDFRGHYLNTPSRFWTLTLMTGAQIAADCGGELSMEDMKRVAEMSQGRYGNPMLSTMTSGMNWGYVNSDQPYLGMIWDSWKFPVLECLWEDWDVYKYRSITRTADNVQESFDPVGHDFPKKDGEVYIDPLDGVTEKRVNVKDTHVHHYRQCKWIINTDITYRWGKVPFCPRDPQDIRVALCPVKIYRAAGNPYTQRLKPIAKMAMNAWFKFQNEVARARPSGVKVNIASMDNVTTIDGKKVTRRNILELFNEEGTLIYSDRGAMDDMGITRRADPIEPLQNVDIAAMQRWIDTINWCSLRFQQESGLNQFTDASTPNPETPATSAKAAIQGSNNAMQQYMDAVNKIGEELAIDTAGKIQQLVRQGHYLGYQSSIGTSLLKNVPITEDITMYTFGIRVHAKPTQMQRMELKQEIRTQFNTLGDPTQGSLYMGQLLYLEQLLDQGTNLKIVALMASSFHRQNMRKIQEAKAQEQQAVAEAQKQIAASAAQDAILTEQALSEIRINEYAAMREIDKGLETHKTQLKTQDKLITADAKSAHKQQEKLLEATMNPD